MTYCLDMDIIFLFCCLSFFVTHLCYGIVAYNYPENPEMFLCNEYIWQFLICVYAIVLYLCNDVFCKLIVMFALINDGIVAGVRLFYHLSVNVSVSIICKACEDYFIGDSSCEYTHDPNFPKENIVVSKDFCVHQLNEPAFSWLPNYNTPFYYITIISLVQAVWGFVVLLLFMYVLGQTKCCYLWEQDEDTSDKDYTLVEVDEDTIEKKLLHDTP